MAPRINRKLLVLAAAVTLALGGCEYLLYPMFALFGDGPPCARTDAYRLPAAELVKRALAVADGPDKYCATDEVQKREMKASGSIIPLIVPYLYDQNPVVVDRTVRLLAVDVPLPAAIRPRLLELAHGDFDHASRELASDLAQARTPEIIPNLIAVMNRDSRETQENVGLPFAHPRCDLYGYGPTAVPALLENLKAAPDIYGRLSSARLLDAIGSRDATPAVSAFLHDALPAIVAELPDDSAQALYETRSVSIEALGKNRRAVAKLLILGPLAAPAVPELSQTLFDPDNQVSEMSCQLLRENFPISARSVLESASKKTGLGAEWCADTALKEIKEMAGAPTTHRDMIFYGAKLLTQQDNHIFYGAPERCPNNN